MSWGAKLDVCEELAAEAPGMTTPSTTMSSASFLGLGPRLTFFLVYLQV